MTIGNAGNMARNQVLYGPGPLAAAADIVIPPGGTAQVAKVLSKAGAIGPNWIFRLAVWSTRAEGPVKAGEYLIPAHASVAQILGILRAGMVVQHQVTIPEGLTAMEIAGILQALPDATGPVPAFSEGAVLPQTYDYTRGTSRALILARAEAAMDKAVAAAWATRAPGLPITAAKDAVTLAAIVQEESPLPEELPEIAAVYENRLTKGMRLQADPTVIYAASGGRSALGGTITKAELANLSAYNSYRHDGLPPGPICAPGLAALQAVLHPAPSNALFFVATGKGGHVFAQDYTAQRRNEAAYRAAKN